MDDRGAVIVLTAAGPPSERNRHTGPSIADVRPLWPGVLSLLVAESLPGTPGSAGGVRHGRECGMC